MHRCSLTAAVAVALGLACILPASAAEPGADTHWLGFNGGLDATRYSPLTQVDTKNVANLREVARFKLPETLSFQCNPVVVGDTMYITSVKSTYAIDARTGQQKWVRTIEPMTQMIGTPVRGVGYAGWSIVPWHNGWARVVSRP